MSTKAKASSPKKQAPSPHSQPAAPVTLKQLQQRLDAATKAKEVNASKGKKLDEKLRIAFKNQPKRLPNGLTEAKIQEEMDKLEHRRNTISMSLNDEKFILRELQSLKETKTKIHEFQQFQETIDAMKKEREDCFQQHRAFNEQITQLQAASKKMKLADAIGCQVADLVTIDVSVPEDKMGAVIGKGSAKLHQIEQDCQVLLEVDDARKVMRVTSTSVNTVRAKEAIENITLATSHSIGLHPDTIKILLFQKSKNLQELEQTFGVRIDINKAEGMLTVMASPAKAKQLDKAIKELSESKVEIPLPAEIVPKLIGKKGETINQLMEDTGCLVDIDKVANSVLLCGTKESVGMAKKFVYELIEAQSVREKEFSADANPDLFPSPAFATHKFAFFAEFLMANKAQQLKILRTDASEAKIKVLKQEQKIHVIGNKTQLKAMDEALRERLREFENHHWLYEVQDGHLLSLIIGKKGAQIKEIEQEGEEAKVRIDIQGNHVCVFGDNAKAIEHAKLKIMEIVDQNQRSLYMASKHLVPVLMNNKRAKLQEIETSSACKLQLPPPPSAGAKSDDDQVKITLTGTLEAISKAKSLLEALDECHHVRYMPLDDDEVPTVIGKKGETVSQLEKSSGAKIRVLREQGADAGPELEMIGTKDQLAAAQKAIDELLQTKNREILQLDSFATSCLVGKKGERIQAIRQEHPDATIDAFIPRGQVRIKATSEEALKKCVEHVLTTLRETLMVETVRVPSTPANTSTAPVTFSTLFAKDDAITMRLQELEAEGGENMKVTIADDGKSAKIRGPAMGIGKMKKFLEMLVSNDSLFVETIPLPTFAFASVLLAKGSTEKDGKLNENALRICKQTGCELRVKKNATTTGKNKTETGAIRIEGTNATKVYEAKESVEKVLQFYYSDCFYVVDKLPVGAIPRLYELLPTLAAKYRVVFSLAGKTSLRVMTDTKASTKEIVKLLENEVTKWKKQHVEIAVPAWMVPLLVGKNGDAIKKLSQACGAGAKLDLSARGGGSNEKYEDRVLTVSARDDATVKNAVEKVQQALKALKDKSSSLHVTKDKLDLALSLKKEAASGIQFHVLDATDGVEVLLYGGEKDDRDALIEKMQHLIKTTAIERIVLPTTVSQGVRNSVIGALIGKGGSNIKALQNQFPGVMVDIQRQDNSISLKGPQGSVLQVKHVMQDKVDELLQQEQSRAQRRVEEDDQKLSAKRQPQQPHEENKKLEEEQQEDDENAKPNRPLPPAIPVGASAAMMTTKLNKNQRRRMRKRAENEKKSDVLSMIMGGSTTTDTDPTSPPANTSGYYHSSSGYTLRL